MRRDLVILFVIFLSLFCAMPGKTQERGDTVAGALAEGNDFLKQKDYDRALAAYRKADKLAHHTCADCLLGMFSADRGLGNLQASLNDAKQAAKAAGNDQAKAAQAHLVRGALLAQMASKPNDKRLKEAEGEMRQVLALAPATSIAHFNLGKILIRQGRDDEGIVELKSYLAAPDANPKTVLAARRMIANPIFGREPFAPDFSFVTLEGEKLSNAALRGKVVLLDFWGAWCVPCRASLPLLLSIRNKYQDRPFQIVGVSSDEDEQLWKGFIASHHMDWPEYLDTSGAVQEAFEVDSFPTFIVLDRDGIITYSLYGWDSNLATELEEAISRALKRPSNPAAVAAAAASVPQQSARPPEASRAAAATPVPSSQDAGTLKENGVITGNVYRNDELGFTYDLPSNWIAALPEVVWAATAQSQADARARYLEQYGEKGDPSQIAVPTILFYASQGGRGDGYRLSSPCVRITAMPWQGSNGRLIEVETNLEKMLPPGTSLARGPEEYTVNGQQFCRADLANTGGVKALWRSRILTVARGQLLTVEIFARDQQELERLDPSAALKLLDAQ